MAAVVETAALDVLTRRVGPAFVINLPARGDRRAEMARELRNVGLAWDSPRVTLYPAARPTELFGFDSIGAHGCFLSHLGVLERASAAGLESLLILEDDCSFIAGVRERLRAINAALQDVDWSFFYGGCLFYEAQPPPALPGRAIVEVAPQQPLWLTHCVAVRGAALKELPAYLRAMLARPVGHPDGGVMDVDGAYCWFRRQHPQYKTFVASPEIAYQRSSRTDVSPLSWHDRTPVVRDLLAAARKLRNLRRR